MDLRSRVELTAPRPPLMLCAIVQYCNEFMDEGRKLRNTKNRCGISVLCLPSLYILFCTVQCSGTPRPVPL
jgi:hypothetical protein